MPNLRRALAVVLAIALGVTTVVRCDRAGQAPRADTATSLLPPAAEPPAPSLLVPSGWDPRAGPVLLIAGEHPDAAIVVFPEVQGEHTAAALSVGTAPLRGLPVTLVSRAGTVVTAMLGDSTAPGEEEHCVGWPMLRVVSPSTAGAPPWDIGFLGAQLMPVPLDSVGSLSPVDSAALVAEVARLASAIPARTAAARMRGLPFSVRDVRRFHAAPGTDAIVALVVRRLHQEASPIEERTLLIAERDTTQQQRVGIYTLAFHQRAAGPEETLEGTDVLAGLTITHRPQPMLVIARESEGGVRYALLERLGPRSWRVKWTSALVRC